MVGLLALCAAVHNGGMEGSLIFRFVCNGYMCIYNAFCEKVVEL